VSNQVQLLFRASDGKHLWSIDELHGAVVEVLGAADYSTVFRAVSGLERDGFITRIDLGDGKVHYELSDDHGDEPPAPVQRRLRRVRFSASGLGRHRGQSLSR
jgi:Fe2+ or Zn2+ uptake regulation protein